MRRLPTTLILGLAVCLSPAQAQVSISPIIQETRLDQPAKVMTFRLTNLHDQAKHVAVTVSNWTLADSGDVAEIPSTETSLDRWLIVSPLQFTVAANSTQAIRVAIRPAVELAPGEHRAMVYFQEVLPPRATGQTGIRGRFRIGAAVYAYQGEPQRIGTISGLRADAGGISAQLSSSGSAHARLQGFYAVWRADAFSSLDASPLANMMSAPPKDGWPDGLVEARDLPKLPVLPGGRRPFQASFGELGPGRYVIEFRGGMSGVPAPQALPIVVPAPSAGD